MMFASEIWLSIGYVGLLCLIQSAESLDCFTCTNIHNISDCRTFTTCAQNEQCFTKTTGLGDLAVFNLGCKSAAECHGTTTQPQISSIVGRSAKDRSTTDCEQCCSVDYCNKKLCNQAVDIITSTDGQCHDDADYNCELISGVFNVCGDPQHAKKVCRKWCGLCDMVDGRWSSWLSWSKCGVTCGNGQRSRSRTCTEPSPSHGGLDCVGMTSETGNCTLDSCPVHGGWSTWSPWGSCSVTCGVGLRRRDRSCSSPYPGLGGNHCFGDARDDRVCFEKACADGGWSNWADWGSCSATCNGGMKTRSRLCNNPIPSLLGKSCDGDSMEYISCNTKACSAPMAAFTVNSPTGFLVGNNNPTFTTIVENIGGGYNTTTGVFTCTQPGLYHFYVHLLVNQYPDIHYSYCYIFHNNKDVVQAFTQSGSSQYHSGSASAYIRLSAGDTVSLQCGGWQYVHTGDITIFTGALITPE